MSHPTCEQRIDDELSQRLMQLLPPVESWKKANCRCFLTDQGKTVTAADLRELRVQALDIVHEQAAGKLWSIETIHTFKLCLSYGGPADYFALDYSKSRDEWIGGRYLFQDWFDGASRPLSAEVAERLGELFGLYPGAY